jgi:phosphoenolpyruvate-protein phosphotransferase
MKEYRGIAASPGIAIGPIFQYRPLELKIERYAVEDAEAEMQRLRRALDEASAQLTEVRSRAVTQVSQGEAAIFDAHLTILQDPELLALTRKTLEQNRLNVENAWLEATEHYAIMLEEMSNEYMRARAADIRDVSQRVLRILLGVGENASASLNRAAVIVAPDLTPSDTINFDKDLVLGFCTAGGGLTSHTAILARSLGLPAIVGAGDAVTHLSHGSQAALDGGQGLLVTEPTPDVVSEYERRREAELAIQRKAVSESHKSAVTQDGHQVEIVANIGNVAGAGKAVELGAEGVGLLRTEFLYLERSSIPDEQEQYEVYKSILDVFGDLPVVMRTLDVGGDKELPYLDIERENNPFLGVRGLRLCLSHLDLFKPQLRAALRAGAGHRLRLMFPMVAVADEVRQARRVLEECRQELAREGQPMAEDLQVGIMVEIPSAALMADSLAQEVDFFSIGTNDLTQYTLAADRTNAELAHLSSAFSPAVLQLIQMVIRAAHRYGKWVGLCGELAGEPLAIPILLGLDLDEFSMNPISIPPAKALIRSLTIPACQQLAQKALSLPTAEEVQAYVREQIPLFAK